MQTATEEIFWDREVLGGLSWIGFDSSERANASKAKLGFLRKPWSAAVDADAEFSEDFVTTLTTLLADPARSPV